MNTYFPIFKKKNYLPKYNFSSNIKEATIVTNNNIKGLKTDANKGPLIFMHHEVTITTNPEATTPYNIKIKHQINIINSYMKFI